MSPKCKQFPAIRSNISQPNGQTLDMFRKRLWLQGWGFLNIMKCNDSIRHLSLLPRTYGAVIVGQYKEKHVFLNGFDHTVKLLQ